MEQIKELPDFQETYNLYQGVAVISAAYAGQEGFEIHHRFVGPEYRGKQGIGGMLLKCAESFAKGFSTAKQEKIIFFAGTAQLDVIYWFWKNGYRPEEEKDWRKLNMITNGDESLCLEDGYYVFDKSVPEADRYQTGKDGQFLLENDRKVVYPRNSFKISAETPPARAGG